jgi:hypothetical protein
MEMKERVWHEFIDVRFADEYLCLYISRQKKIRKQFKLATLIFSAGGISSAFANYKIPTIILLFLIALSQLATLLETHLFPSDKDIEELGKLRSLFYSRWNKLERLFIVYDTLSENEGINKFFEIRKEADESESLYEKLCVKNSRKLLIKAEEKNREYLNKHHHG